MTSEQLIEEGRRLQRPCAILRREGSGPVAAVWYESDEEVRAHELRCWLTLDARCIPDLDPSITGYLSVFADEGDLRSGRVEVTAAWPDRKGIPLYAHPVSILPPLDAVFQRGAVAVGEWLVGNGWERSCRYNDNFCDRAATDGYWEAFSREHPLFFEDAGAYAMVGGWHLPGPDGDWEELIDEHLMVMTLHDSEPWVEAWHRRSGEFSVIQRMT